MIHRRSVLDYLPEGISGRLLQMDICDLTFPDTSFDGVTILEVLEHLHNPEVALRQALRVARRFVIASVPSTLDDNPEHRHLFTVNRLREMAVAGGCPQPKIEHVLNHRILICLKP